MPPISTSLGREIVDAARVLEDGLERFKFSLTHIWTSLESLETSNIRDIVQSIEEVGGILSRVGQLVSPTHERGVPRLLEHLRAERYSRGLQKLPDEIMAWIFQLTAADRLQNAFSIACVNRRWRRIALSWPRMWSFIRLQSAWRDHDMVSCSLGRSERCALHVDVVMRDIAFEVDFILLMQPHSSRLRSGRFDCSSIPEFVDYLSSFEAPDLEELSLIHHFPYDSRPLFNPSLTFPQVKRLSLHVPREMQYLHLLRMTPNLESLVVTVICRLSSSQIHPSKEYPGITHVRLSSSTIGNFVHIFHPFKSLSTPNLTHLEIVCDPRERMLCVDWAPPLMTYPSLTTLSIAFRIANATTLDLVPFIIKFMARQPSLSILRLSGDSIVGEILDSADEFPSTIRTLSLVKVHGVGVDKLIQTLEVRSTLGHPIERLSVVNCPEWLSIVTGNRGAIGDSSTIRNLVGVVFRDDWWGVDGEYLPY